jgi:Ribbon-helix-helix protein, copG family
LRGSSQGGAVARRTKIAKVITSVRVPRRDMDAVYVLARREGVSQSEFVCTAIKEKLERAALEQVTER